MVKIVNSWNEWDPLKHIIVGRADNCCIAPVEPAMAPKIPEDSDMKGKFGPRPQHTIDRANYLLDNFSEILKKKRNKSRPSITIRFQQENWHSRLEYRDNVWLHASQRCYSYSWQ